MAVRSLSLSLFVDPADCLLLVLAAFGVELAVCVFLSALVLLLRETVLAGTMRFVADDETYLLRGVESSLESSESESLNKIVKQ